MIPYGRQEITENDIRSVIKVLQSDFITQGPAIPLFENELCNKTSAKYSVAVNSCTSALHIACLALDLGPGDWLWTVPITFVATANCALYCGASVDFVDIEQETGLMSVENLKEKLVQAERNGKLPKIVVPVHFAGQPCDMYEIHQLSMHYGFKIIEDAAHAIGSKYKNNVIGNCRFSDITVFSFHPVKIITSGEGGAAMTNNYKYFAKMSILRSHGITRDQSKMNNKSYLPWRYEQIDLGFNYRMTDIHAALGMSQLVRLDQYILRRSIIAKSYDESLEDMNVDVLIKKKNRTSANHLNIIMVRGGEDFREIIYNRLYEYGIGVNVHYIPVHLQPYYSTRKYNDLRNSEEFSKKIISLPIFPALSEDDMKKVVEQLHCALEEKYE